ncbi:MAG: hypothetical protein AB8G86_01750, partial [Saprospiraceae bacterium]
ILLYSKFSAVEVAFTHTLNELRYYIITGIVVLICTAGFVLKPNYRLVIVGFISTFFSYLFLENYFPGLNFFVRASIVIATGFLLIAIPAFFQKGMRPLKDIYQSASPQLTRAGVVLLVSLVVLHLIFH